MLLTDRRFSPGKLPRVLASLIKQILLSLEQLGTPANTIFFVNNQEVDIAEMNGHDAIMLTTSEQKSMHTPQDDPFV